MPITEGLVARLLAAVLIGLALGCAIGASFVHQAQQGRSLTMKEYVGDFQRHKADLEKSPTFVAALAISIALAFGLFGVYEGLRVILEKLLRWLARGGPAAGPEPELHRT